MAALFRNQLVTLIGIFCAGLLLFTVGLSHQEIIGFESRFYLFAMQMWRHGISWFPTINNIPYPDYPVTATLLIYGVAKLVGHLDKWAAVFPSAVAASLTLVMTYLIGALHDKRWGWMAVFFLLLTLTFLSEARTISPDQYVTLVTVSIFYLAHSAKILQKPQRLWFIPFLLLFGFACRGPIGLVIPAAVLSIFYFIDKNFKKFWLSVGGAFVLLIIGCAILGGIAYQAGGMPLVKTVWHSQVFGRIQQEANVSWYFYFTESVGAYAWTYPIAILLGGGLAFELIGHRRKDKTFLLQLAGWIIIILLGMTIPAAKKIRYILPMAPALALFAAYLLAVPQKQKYLRYLRRITFWGLYFLPTICLLAVVILREMPLMQQLHQQILYPQMIVLFLVFQCVNWMFRKDEVLMLGVTALTAVMFYIFVVEHVNLQLNRTHNMVMLTEILRANKHADLVFYQESPDGLPIKYMANVPHEIKPVFINTPEELATYKEQAIFITNKEYYAKIPLPILEKAKIISVGDLGHDPVVIFEKVG